MPGHARGGEADVESFGFGPAVGFVNAGEMVVADLEDPGTLSAAGSHDDAAAFESSLYLSSPRAEGRIRRKELGCCG